MTAAAPPRTITDRLTAHVWWIFGAWLTTLGAIHAVIWAGHGWVWFPGGAHLLFSPSWSHLYAQHNDLQIGPRRSSWPGPASSCCGRSCP